MELTLKISDIEVPKRLRELKQDKLSNVIESIEEVGLINPITVLHDAGKYTLIAGEHRLRAFETLGNKEILCNVRERKYEDIEMELALCTLIEVDENIVRTKLDRYEESYMLHMRKEAYEKLYPETTQWAKKSQAGKEKSNNLNYVTAPFTEKEAVQPKTFAQDTAEKLGVSEISVSRKVRRGTILDEETGKTTDKLKLTDRVVDLIISGDDEKAKEASKIHVETIKQLAEIIPDEKERNKVFDNAFKDLKDKKESIKSGYQKIYPNKFAIDLQQEMNVYIKEHQADRDDEAVKYTDNVLICTTSYLNKYPDTESRFVRVYLDNACRFAKTKNIIEMLKREEKVLVECANDRIFNEYITKYN